jgi:hypothetical protein
MHTNTLRGLSLSVNGPFLAYLKVPFSILLEITLFFFLSFLHKIIISFYYDNVNLMYFISFIRNKTVIKKVSGLNIINLKISLIQSLNLSLKLC